ncbi:MAG: sigma-E processing peptidase SpoIIGA [Firmicutes bacterium]|nr:sigma-E processing peptidase SpoIIGA [Bacillota bacterium]
MYLDLVMALNLAVNFFLLWLTGLITDQKNVLVRLLAGSALGAAFLLVVFLPSWHPFYTWIGKTLVPLLMVLISFRPRLFGQGALLFLTLYFCSCVLGGMVFAFSLWGKYPLDFSKGIYYLPAPSLYYLLLSGILLYFVVRGLKIFLLDRFNFRLLTTNIKIEICFCGKSKKLSAFLDTGNLLREPFSGLPVAVVSYAVVKELLPPELGRLLGNNGGIDWHRLEKVLAGISEAAKFCLVPYRTLQGRDFLLGFKPENTRLWQEGNCLGSQLKLIIGVQSEQVHPTAEYEVLLPLEIWRSANKQEGLKK